MGRTPEIILIDDDHRDDAMVVNLGLDEIWGQLSQWNGFPKVHFTLFLVTTSNYDNWLMRWYAAACSIEMPSPFSLATELSLFSSCRRHSLRPTTFIYASAMHISSMEIDVDLSICIQIYCSCSHKDCLLSSFLLYLSVCSFPSFHGEFLLAGLFLLTGLERYSQ